MLKAALAARKSAHNRGGKKRLGKMISPGFFYFEGDSVGKIFVGGFEMFFGHANAVEFVLFDFFEKNAKAFDVVPKCKCERPSSFRTSLLSPGVSANNRETAEVPASVGWTAP